MSRGGPRGGGVRGRGGGGGEFRKSVSEELS